MPLRKNIDEGTNVDEANVMVCHCVDCQVFSVALTEQLFFAKVKTLKLKVKIGRKSTSRQRLKVEIKESKHFAENVDHSFMAAI